MAKHTVVPAAMSVQRQRLSLSFTTSPMSKGANAGHLNQCRRLPRILRAVNGLAVKGRIRKEEKI
jgi:hypothetical protein